MSGRRKKLLILLIIFLGITVIRETGTFSMSFFSSSISNMSSENWNIITDAQDVSLQEIKNKNIKTCTAFSSPKDVPIFITCMGYTIGQVRKDGEIYECSPKRIGIDHIDTGPIWMPLFKYGSYSCDVPVHLVFSTCRKDSNKIKYCTYQFNVNLNISGTLRIIGPCSYRTAKEMLAKQIINSAYSTVRRKLDELE